MKKLIAGLACLASVMTAAAVQAAPIVGKVKERGELRCGVGDPTPGWHSLDNKNRWEGFGVDFCRAIAAAVLGNAEKVAILPVGWAQAYEALRSGEVDVVTTSHTFRVERDAGLQVNFPWPYQYTGITVMVRKDLKISSFSDLGDATICLLSGSSMEAKVGEWFRARKLNFKALPFDTMTAVSEAYSKGRCDAVAGEPALLAGFRSAYPTPDQHAILPELFSVDALGPMTAEGDEQWDNVVRAVIFATIAADQFSITSKNVDEVAGKSTTAEVRRLLGVEGTHGKSLGISPNWARDLIKQVGPYSAIYDRNLGMGSAIKLEPGFNTLAGTGGLLHSPQF